MDFYKTEKLVTDLQRQRWEAAVGGRWAKRECSDTPLDFFFPFRSSSQNVWLYFGLDVVCLRLCDYTVHESIVDGTFHNSLGGWGNTY